MTSQNYNFDSLNVMVVDDNKHMLAIVKTILHAMRIKNVRTISNAADAFSEMQHWPVDLIITDWAMEPLDGLDFCRLLRRGEDSAHRFVPIIMLTGHTEAHRVIEARDAGINEVLVKPVSIEALCARVSAIIESPRPFVKSLTYFGPCRRRAQVPYQGVDRRSNSESNDMANAV